MRTRIFVGALAIIMVFIMVFYVLFSPGVQEPYPQPPSTAGNEEISFNWAGYAVERDFSSTEANVVDNVSGSWVVPQVECSLFRDYSSSFWIGVDGYTVKSGSQGTIEQIGTDSDCYRGYGVYFAWYELFPQDPVTLNLTISPGDTIHAQISYLGNGRFLMSITDMTTGEHFSVTKNNPQAQRTSAEWIAEAPSSGNHTVPLSDFSRIDFMDASVTMSGVTGPISGPGWQYQSIIMEDRSGMVKAEPTALSEQGTAFSVLWEHM